MIRYRASWVVPIADDPLSDAWVELAGGRITALGTAPAGDAVDLGRAAILPALVNAHTHFELAYLHGAVAREACFIDWIRALMRTRQEHPDPAGARIVGAARDAIQQARASGTGLVGDVGNTLVTVPLLREAGMPARVFHELLGFNERDPGARVASAEVAIEAAGRDAADVRVSLAPHAPYSVSPALFRAIRTALDAHPSPVSTVHLGESAAEIELLRRGTGPWKALLEELGVWADDWRPPGASPVAYLSDLGFLDRSVLVVHGVQFDGEDLSRLRALDATIVSCPRSNRHVGVGPPPLEAFYAMGVDVAFGTDSLASVDDLNLFAELEEARRIAPRVPARRLLESATLTGARALGFERGFGSIEVGKRASLIAVRVPDEVVDVEEYLVAGVAPEAVAWLDGDGSAPTLTS